MYTHSMETIYLSLVYTQVAEGTFFMKSPVPVHSGIDYEKFFIKKLKNCHFNSKNILSVKNRLGIITKVQEWPAVIQ